MRSRSVLNFPKNSMNLRLYIKDILIHVLQRRIRALPVSILMYHSVGLNSHFFTVKPEDFRWQMLYLKTRGYRVSSLVEVVNGLIGGKKIPAKTVVLTFDDGYEDNFKNVFPVLQELNLPATIFMTTDFIGTNQSVRGVDMKYLSKEQILEMNASDLIHFEPHGLAHRKLTELNLNEAEEEMNDSKIMLENLLSRQCKLFAYPYGKSNPAIRDIAKKLFVSAVGVRRGYVSHESDIMNLERQSIDSLTTSLRFRLKI